MSHSLMSFDYIVLRHHLTLVHQQTHRAAVTAVNQATTWRNRLIGAWIFEYEQAEAAGLDSAGSVCRIIRAGLCRRCLANRDTRSRVEGDAWTR